MKERIPKIHLYYHQSDMDGHSSGYLMYWAFKEGIVNCPLKEAIIYLNPFNYGFYIKEDYIYPQDMLDRKSVV